MSRIKMQTTICNLCNSNEYEPVHQLYDLLLERDTEIFAIVRCRNCGLVYQNPRPSLEEIAQYYPPEYESYTADLKDNQISWLLKKAYSYGIDKRGKIVRRYKKSGRLLDVGCATGVFLTGMQSSPDWELYGVEISEHAARIAREQNFLNVTQGTLHEAHYPSDFFDAVTLWDVLEHLHDPLASLREIHRILKKDGILVFRVPNLNSWDAMIFGPAWAGLDAPRHLYVFHPDTLSTLLHNTNFNILRMGCDIGSYPTFLLSLRFWLQMKGAKRSARELIFRILYHPFMRILSAPFFYAYGIGLRGPLITVAATKQETN
jgi:2-polyprenyl-3-methyl-5-hydroxy-6-metoxy-1,4-benzoquinol methylase